MGIKDIATVFRARIDEQGLKLKTVAERAGLSPQALSAMLNHRQKIPATAFIQLCRVLQLDAADFV